MRRLFLIMFTLPAPSAHATSAPDAPPSIQLAQAYPYPGMDSPEDFLRKARQRAAQQAPVNTQAVDANGHLRQPTGPPQGTPGALPDVSRLQQQQEILMQLQARQQPLYQE